MHCACLAEGKPRRHSPAPTPTLAPPRTCDREQLIGLTDVTRSHFEKLVDEFEKGLDAALKEYDGGCSVPCLFDAPGLSCLAHCSSGAGPMLCAESRATPLTCCLLRCYHPCTAAAAAVPMEDAGTSAAEAAEAAARDAKGKAAATPSRRVTRSSKVGGAGWGWGVRGQGQGWPHAAGCQKHCLGRRAGRQAGRQAGSLQPLHTQPATPPHAPSHARLQRRQDGAGGDAEALALEEAAGFWQ